MRARPHRSLPAAAAVASIAAGVWLLANAVRGDALDAAMRAYHAGRFADAAAAYAEAERERGDTAPAELLVGGAVAALQAGQLRAAEAAAEKAAARGGPAWYPTRDFLLGNAAFARSARAEAETTLTEPDPTAFARAIGHAEAARAQWQRAAAARDDWPAARRNAERASRKLEALQAAAEEAERQRRAKQSAQAGAEPAEQPPDEPTEQQLAVDPTAQRDPNVMSRAQLEELLALLGQKEQEKRALRRARQAARSARVEKDW